MTDYTKLEKSLEHLTRQYENFEVAQDRRELTDLDREAIRESVIQRFEIAYDILWKTIKRHLSEELGLVDVPSSPKPVLRLAGQSDLLGSPTEDWLAYADARTATSHDYSQEKASETLALIHRFLPDAQRVFLRMSESS